MRPPRCVICSKVSRSNSDGFKLVRFKLTEEQEVFNLEMKESNKVGHPRGTDWFCADHYNRAIELKNRPNIEAIKIMKAESKEN